MDRIRKISLLKVFALTISLIAFALFICSLLVEETTDEYGIPTMVGFAYHFYSFLTCGVSLLLYAIDALVSIVRSLQGNRPIFHAVLALVLFGGIPMWFFVGEVYALLETVIWYTYYLGMCVLEVISIVKDIRYDGI